MADKTKKEYSELKKRALLAKERLKMGYWQRLLEEKRNASGDTLYESICLLQEKVRRDEQKLLCADKATEEERFYDKVCAILEQDENTLDPIGQLIDRDEYERLGADNRQRYILQLSQKFREMRERYYREKRSS